MAKQPRRNRKADRKEIKRQRRAQSNRPATTSAQRVSRAKKNITRLLGQGVRINPNTESQFTREVLAGKRTAKRKMQNAADRLSIRTQVTRPSPNKGGRKKMR